MQLSRAQIIGLVALVVVIAVGYMIVRFGRGARAVVTLVTPDVTVSSPAYNPADQSVYFLNRLTEQLAKVDSSGTVTHLSDRLPNVDLVRWSPDFRQALIRSINDEATKEGNLLFRADADDGLILTWLFTLADKKLTFVNADYGSVLWAGTEEIIYYFAGDNPGDVSLAKPDGTERQPLLRIEEILVSDLIAYLPNQGMLLTGGTDEEEDKLYFLNLATKALTPLADKAVAWAGGSNILFFSFAEPTVVRRFDPARETGGELVRTESPISHLAVGSDRALLATEDALLSLNLATKRLKPIDIGLGASSDLFVFSGGDRVFFFTAGSNLYRLELP